MRLESRRAVRIQLVHVTALASGTAFVNPVDSKRVYIPFSFARPSRLRLVHPYLVPYRFHLLPKSRSTSSTLPARHLKSKAVVPRFPDSQSHVQVNPVCQGGEGGESEVPGVPDERIDRSRVDVSMNSLQVTWIL